MSKSLFDPVSLATKTADAYSADSYSNWTACARLLARLGYNEHQAEAILRSKWTRWARDMWQGRGTPTSMALRDFLIKYRYTPTHPEVISLTEETFGTESDKVQ